MKREVVATNPNQAMMFLADVNCYPCKITITDDIKKRSLPANSLQHLWYKAISDYTGEDIKTAGNSCKLDFGLPILLSGEYGKKVSFTLNKIGFESWSRQQQIGFMDLLQVTSLFTSAEHTIYRDNIESFWREHGLVLEYEKR
jgi:hypothetical protein